MRCSTKLVFLSLFITATASSVTAQDGGTVDAAAFIVRQDAPLSIDLQDDFTFMVYAPSGAEAGGSCVYVSSPDSSHRMIDATSEFVALDGAGAVDPTNKSRCAFLTPPTLPTFTIACQAQSFVDVDVTFNDNGNKGIGFYLPTAATHYRTIATLSETIFGEQSSAAAWETRHLQQQCLDSETIIGGMGAAIKVDFDTPADEVAIGTVAISVSY